MGRNYLAIMFIIRIVLKVGYKVDNWNNLGNPNQFCPKCKKPISLEPEDY